MKKVLYVDELQHHGVKGMKWGVRKAIESQPQGIRNRVERDLQSINNITKYGWNQGHGKNVYSRLQAVSKDEKRMSRMSSRQKQSLNNATEYWKRRSQSKNRASAGKRNVIARFEDSYRSHSFNERATNAVLSGIAQRSTKGIASNATTMVGNEIVNKMLGHF